MRLKYQKQIVDMLYNEWDLCKKNSKAKGKTCAWIYWFEILNEAEKIIYEKKDNKVIGICAYSKKFSKKYFLRKKFYGILKNILIFSPLIKDRKVLFYYNNAYDSIPKELENYFDGEITVIIVDKLYRGQGIGKKLLDKTFEIASKDNMKNIQILTDESCNYKFYEKLNCNKIYERLIYNADPKLYSNAKCEKGFIYEKILKA